MYQIRTHHILYVFICIVVLIICLHIFQKSKMNTMEPFQVYYKKCTESTKESGTCIVYIISWKRVSENARNVFDAVKRVHDQTFILNCDENFSMNRGESVIEADDSYYFTKQMYTIFNHCNTRFPESHIMTITGDVSPIADWKGVIDRCMTGFKKHKAGIVAPNVDYTSHSDKIKDLDDNYSIVENTDCTVWTLKPCVYKFLLNTDIDKYNKFGWGIDWLLIKVCEKNDLLVIRDYSHTIQHPKDHGYGNEKAMMEYDQVKRKWEDEYVLKV